MSDDVDVENSTNYQAFRDCVFAAIVEKSTGPASKTKHTPSKRRRSQSSKTAITEPNSTDDYTSNDPSDLADFSDYLAHEIFTSLPLPLQTLTHTTPQTDDYTLPLTLTTLETFTSHLPPSVPDTLTTYALITPPTTDTTTFLSPILTSYITSTTTPPPAPSSTRTTFCELCLRDWIPLTYHHLIPRSIHAKALKRGWHEEGVLNSVAWLCRACHSFVHRTVGNEELAREWFTVERLAERDDVQRWVKWVGGVRWKKR